MEDRNLLLRAILRPHGIDPDEVLEDDGIHRGCIAERRGAQWRIVTGPPLVPNALVRPMTGMMNALRDAEESRAREPDGLADAIERARADWSGFLSRVMRDRSVETATGDRTARPAWSILASPVTRAVAALAGLDTEHLTRNQGGGAPRFPTLGETELAELPDTPWYRRADGPREGDDHLSGQYLLNHADHVVQHSLQLLSDPAFPIRSVSDAGSTTLVEVRHALAETACGALVGRRLSDLLGLPGFEPGSPAGDAEIVGARANDPTGRTGLQIAKRYLPLADPPQDADMRWLGLTPAWR